MKTGSPAIYASAVIMTCLLLVVAAMLSFAAENLWAQKAKEIDAGVHACLGRFYHQIKGGREMVAMAERVLVMPGVLKAGFIVGGEYGEGALRVGGKTVPHYRLASGSVGLQIKGEAKDGVMLFMTSEASKQFQAGKGWEVGVDGSAALVDFGGGERLNFITMNDPIIGFVFDVKGLMADTSLKGAKFTKFDPK